MYPTFFDAMAARADARWRAVEEVGAVLLVAALTAAAAQISIPLPFTPVPFTFQPMVVLVGAAALGSRRGSASQILYLMLGIAGLPVFAAGWLAERGFDRRYATFVLAMACGLTIVFAGGVLWLAAGTQPARGLSAALAAGFYPFIVADVVKLFVAANVMPGLWRIKNAK